MKTASRESSAMSNEQWAALAAGGAEVGLAVVRADGVRGDERIRAEGRLLWANACFERLTAEVEEDLLSSSQEERASVCTPAGQTWQIERREIESSDPKQAPLFLVEAVPLGGADTTSSPVDAELDSLTGVLNRQGLERELEQWFGKVPSKSFAVVFLDLDDFKAINDEQGHLVGDESLRQVGSRLRGAVRSGDVVGRFGGDEFVVLVSGITCEEEFQPVAKRLRQIGQSDENPLGVSVGAALTTEGYDNWPAMIHTADRRMYADKRAKKSG